MSLTNKDHAVTIRPAFLEALSDPSRSMIVIAFTPFIALADTFIWPYLSLPKPSFQCVHCVHVYTAVLVFVVCHVMGV